MTDINPNDRTDSDSSPPFEERPLAEAGKPTPEPPLAEEHSAAGGPPRNTTHRYRGVWKTALAFAAGIAVGYVFAGRGHAPRVVYSGAMTEFAGRAAYGPDDAPVTIVEYTDYECGFCARYNRLILPQILENYGDDIRYLIRHFPLAQLHPSATRAARAAVCAERQNALWTYHDLLFRQEQGLSRESLLAYAEQTGLDQDTFETCISSEEAAQVVRNDLERGATYGVRGTPAFFINGRVVFGAQPLEAFTRIIDSALEEARGD